MLWKFGSLYLFLLDRPPLKMKQRNNIHTNLKNEVHSITPAPQKENAPIPSAEFKI